MLLRPLQAYLFRNLWVKTWRGIYKHATLSTLPVSSSQSSPRWWRSWACLQVDAANSESLFGIWETNIQGQLMKISLPLPLAQMQTANQKDISRKALPDTDPLKHFIKKLSTSFHIYSTYIGDWFKCHMNRQFEWLPLRGCFAIVLNLETTHWDVIKSSLFLIAWLNCWACSFLLG